ncbi:MAG: hypothetical protein ACTSWP_09815 [Candidatus Freyarchaeota archaeon]|nr:hypothetical protein [Candidatus Freyrarchaeum guaymaensis]HDO80292.1 hypothetical protein [Candidatus Bathyarchaeota archaeon]
MSRKRRAARRRTVRKRRYALLGALLMIVSPFIPNIYFAFTTAPGQIFPSLTGGITFWLDIIGILTLVMGVIVLIGYLVSERDLSMILTILGGVIGLLLGIVGVVSMLPSLPFGPAAAVIGGILALAGSIS